MVPVKRCIQVSDYLKGLVILDAYHNTVRLHKIFNGSTLLKKLGIRYYAERNIQSSHLQRLVNCILYNCG